MIWTNNPYTAFMKSKGVILRGKVCTFAFFVLDYC